MSYLTFIVAKVLKGQNPDETLKHIKDEYDGEYSDRKGGTVKVVEIEYNHYLDDSDWDFFKKESMNGTLIELFGDGEESSDTWRARFLDGDMETLSKPEQKWPPFEVILTDEERAAQTPKEMSVEEKLLKAKELLESVMSSGYWPFDSPNPCSTEVRIKKCITWASDNLEAALYWHHEMFGKTNRNCMVPPQSVIKDCTTEKS